MLQRIWRVGVVRWVVIGSAWQANTMIVMEAYQLSRLGLSKWLNTALISVSQRTGRPDDEPGRYQFNGDRGGDSGGQQ